MGNCLESDHDSIHSPAEKYAHPLISIPPISAEGPPVVQIHKPIQSGMAQRRIRRPFSVSEVEALVTAVEKVKIGAIDNAKHRTYIDLKDKWKTPVHTAGISPQQRRGEPVPQELLDRVLSTHAYWAQQQAELQS